MLIGTAGHVDHGKSALVEALTGINPMHLPEEHRRELTIELGFAHLRHPDGFTVSLVDVPGHEKLVRTMISGATAFQMALWVVDAREGLMPQSLEHLDILRLLGVPKVIPVITKADPATDEQIRGTMMAIERRLGGGSPVPVVDSLSKRGIDELRRLLLDSCSAFAAAPPPGAGEDLPYLPVDRCFVVQGVGTVVTGTLVRGRLREGGTVGISSSAEVFRIRSLHNHHTTVREIGAGNRVGAHLHGLHAGQIRRGDCLVSPGYPYRSRLLNVTLDLLPHTRFRWRPGVRALFLAAAFEAECRLWGMVEDRGKTWVQIHLPEEACFAPGQRFILRSTNPLTTIGGGTVVDIAPDRLRRVTEAERDPARYFELDRPRLHDSQALSRKWMGFDTPLRAADLRTRNGLIWHSRLESIACDTILQSVSEAGVRQAEWSFQTLASMLKIGSGSLGTLLEALLPSIQTGLQGRLALTSNSLRYDPHRGELSSEERRVADVLTAKLTADGLVPLRIVDYAAASGFERRSFDKALARLLKEGVLVRIDQELVLSRQVWEGFIDRIRRELTEAATVSEFGKRFGLSRKYSVPYLECLARMGITRRLGEKHAVNRRA